MSIEEIHELFLESTGICTDTRTLQEGELFVALKGGNFNGNKYASQALEAGACYAIIDEEAFFIEGKTLVVEDALTCLQSLAKFHRKYLNIPIIAITGSNGKTTTKELLHRVLLQKYSCYATRGNLNNHIGVPLSLLALTSEHEMAIIEMGANHQGEIASYCDWVEANYALITNIGKAHLEGFGGIEGVIKGKTELYRDIASRRGLVFYHLDDPILKEQSAIVDRRISYGQGSEADFTYRLIDNGAFVAIEVEGVQIQSNLIGDYNGVNMASAVAIGQYFDVPLDKIKSSLESYESDNNRSQLIKYKSNDVILDAYNANPTSMMATLAYFKEHQAKKKAVFLGDMFEVGDSTFKEHGLLVDYLSASDFDVFVLVGDQFYKHKNDKGIFFRTTKEAQDWLHSQDFQGFTFLIKGSRGMKMESLLN